MSTMPVQNASTLLSVSEAAKVLGCTGARIRQLLLSGELKGIKATSAENALWLIPEGEVAEAAKRERRKGGRPRVGD